MMPLSSFVQELLAPWYSFRSVCRRILVAFPQLRATVLRTRWYLSLTGEREYCPDVWFDGSVYHCAVLVRECHDARKSVPKVQYYIPGYFSSYRSAYRTARRTAIALATIKVSCRAV
ncbi:hypothetical protein ACSCCW_002331 [Escherichia coli]